jgi:hypothetical protein
MLRFSSGGDVPEAKEPDLAWCAACAIALVTGVEVGGPGPCRGAGVAGEQLGSVLRGRSHELNRAFGMGQQVGTPGRMCSATVVGPDRQKPVGIVDQYQRMGARQPGLRTGRRDEPTLSIPAELRRPFVRGISTLSIGGARRIRNW